MSMKNAQISLIVASSLFLSGFQWSANAGNSSDSYSRLIREAGAFLDFVDCVFNELFDFFGGVGASAREIPNFRCDDGESPPLFASSGGFDRRV